MRAGFRPIAALRGACVFARGVLFRRPAGPAPAAAAAPGKGSLDRPREMLAQEQLRNEIAAHRRTAAALRDSEERFAGAFDAAPVGMVLIAVSEDPPAASTNRAFRAILGYEASEVLATQPLRFIAADDRSAAIEDTRRLFAGEVSSYHAERRLRHKDGHIVWAEVQVSLLRDAGGAPRYLISQVQDITARRQAEEALRQKTAELQAVFEAVPDMFFRADAGGTILAYLAASHARPFAPPEMFLGRTLREVLPEPPASLLHATVAAVCRELAPRTVEYALPIDTGWRTYEARVWPFQGSEAVAVVRDVTEARQRQEQLAHLLRVATMSEMAATLAHEVHQPLQAIVNFATGCTERLQRRTAQPADLREPLEHIAAEAMRAGEIVRRMREFLRTRRPAREWTSVNELVAEIVRLAEPEAMRAGVSIEFAPAAECPSASLDPVQIQQVVLNLIRNGLDAVAAAEPSRLTLRVAITAAGDSVGITVRDSGPGFSPEVAERMFTPLFTTKPHGLGMGLAISRAIAEAHGGALRATSESGRGATFEITLPVEAGDEAGPPFS